MELLFQVCFFVGIGLTLLSLVIGHFADILDMDLFDLDAGGVDFFLPLNPMIYVLGSTVFGGVGLILLNLFPQFPIFFIPSIALIVAILISTCFYKFIILPLRKAQNTSTPSQEDLIGLLAKVREAIPKDGCGEISYVINGNSYIAPAKATDGHSIHKGTDVSICWIEEYVFFVTEIDKQKFKQN